MIFASSPLPPELLLLTRRICHELYRRPFRCAEVFTPVLFRCPALPLFALCRCQASQLIDAVHVHLFIHYYAAACVIDMASRDPSPVVHYFAIS